jgi:hypothetical protein
LESFQNFNVGGGSSVPELYTIGPDGFEYGFIEFVGGGELGLSSEQPMHFCEGMAELFPLGEDVFMPGSRLSRWRPRYLTEIHKCFHLVNPCFPIKDHE